MGSLRWGRQAGAGSGHNGGLAQTGVSFLGQSGSGDFPFMDAVKMIQSWRYSNVADRPRPDELNANGLPITGVGTWEAKGGLFGVSYVPTQAQRAGNFRCKWTGNGTIICAGTTVSGSKTGSGGSGEFWFTPTTDPLTLGVLSGAVDGFTCVHEEDVDAFDAGAIFHPDFLDRLSNSNFGVIRFLDWLESNRSLMTNWASRRPQSYFSYASHEYRESIYAGTTTGSGDNFEIASVDIPANYQYGDTGTYVDKQYAHVWFDRNASSTTCTFRIGSGPAKPIKRHTSDALSTNSRPVSGVSALLIWDAALDAWIKNGGDTNDGFYALHNSVPPEICIALCRELGAHPWFCVPFLASDPLTDWVTGFATHIRDTQPTWMIPRIEGVNEVFHFSDTVGFPGTSYAVNVSNVRNAVAAGSRTITSCTFSGTGSSGTATIGFSADHPWSVGATVTPSSLAGTNIFNFNNIPGQVRSVPNSTTIVLNRAPNTSPATWSSGGTVIGQASDHHSWYGRLMAGIGQAVSDVYSDDRSRYKVVCGVQTGGTSAASASDERMKSNSYFEEFGERAYDWVTDIAVTNYWANQNAHGTNPSPVYGTHTETALTFDYFITSAANPSQQDADLVSAIGTGDLSSLNTKYVNFYAWANGFGPAIGMMGYEGGYSPDYGQGLTTSPITGAVVDDGTHVTLTLATTSIQAAAAISGNSAVVGMYLKITNVGGMTQLNTNTYQVSAVAGNSVTIAVPNTAGFGSYTSGGTAEYYLTTTVTMTAALNTFRFYSKFHPSIETLTETNLSNFAEAGGTFPANLIIAGKTFFSGSYVTTNSAVWAMYDPDIYATPQPALAAYQAYTG